MFIIDTLELIEVDDEHRENRFGLTASALESWQNEARLVCEVPRLRGHDAQILVATGYRDLEAVASAQPEEVLAEANSFLATDQGQRLVRAEHHPDLKEVMNWIGSAEEAKPLEDQLVLSS